MAVSVTQITKHGSIRFGVGQDPEFQKCTVTTPGVLHFDNMVQVRLKQVRKNKATLEVLVGTSSYPQTFVVKIDEILTASSAFKIVT